MRGFLASLLFCSLSSSCLATGDLGAAVPVPMPGGGAGIGFDDLGFTPRLNRVFVPGGRTGKIFLVDPAAKEVSSVGGFTAESGYKGGHGEGVTSADEGRGLFFGTDRNANTVVAVDPKTDKVLASAKLSGNPDYVRYVASTGELWVSEPDSEKIEVFSLSSEKEALFLKNTGEIAVPGGPEFLIIDDGRQRAYSNTWKDQSLVIGLKSRAVEARWPNGCRGSRGLALDAKRGFLFVGCAEGKGVVLDAAHDGKILSTLKAGSGVDVIAYNKAARHLYLPGAQSATMAILSVSEVGTLSLERSVKTARGAHCAAADAGGAWVCDPDHGRLLFFKDEK